jgi:chromosomal replication initiation ATPase DnaA
MMTANSRQLVFDWPHRPALGREDYLVTSCNKDAVDWIDLWPDWPAPVLLLIGPPGCGKSHLAAVWQARTGAVSVDPTALPDAAAIGEADNHHRLLEGASDVADHTAFLHLYNQTAEHRGTLLLTAERPVAHWNLNLPDLISRLRAAPMVEIGMPDDSLLEALLVKMFMDRQLNIEPGVISYLVPRMVRSFSAARTLVMKLDEAALAQRRTITVPLAREVIQENNFETDADK